MTGQAVSSSSNSGSNSSASGSGGAEHAEQFRLSASQNSSSSGISLNSGSGDASQNAISSFSANGVSIIADTTQNAVLVKADPQLMREIESAIQQLDTRREQVLIEAAIIEVEGGDVDQLGVQWALGDLNSGIGLIQL